MYRHASDPLVLQMIQVARLHVTFMLNKHEET